MAVTDLPREAVPLRALRYAFGVFLVAAGLFLIVVVVTIADPGGGLSGIWAGKERAFHDLLGHQVLVAAGFACLSAAMLAAAAGWWRRRRWGRWLGVAIIAADLAGNLVTLRSDAASAALGIGIDAAILTWLLLPVTARVFGRPRPAEHPG